MRADSRTGNRAEGNEGRKKFNVNFIVKTDGFLYNRDTVGASCIVSSAEYSEVVKWHKTRRSVK